MNDDSKWATYRNLSFAPIQISSLLQSSKATTQSPAAEADSPLQNGKHATPVTPSEQDEAAEAQMEVATGENAAPKTDSSKILYRVGVGAAAFVGLSLIVVFLFRPNVPSAAAPQVSPTSATAREAAAPVALASEQPTTQPSPTQEELALQVTAQPVAAAPTAAQAPTTTPLPAATSIPTATPVPSLPRVESIPHALAYTVGKPGQGDIYVMQAGNPKPVAIANAPCDEAEPDWSPDGKRLVFQSNCNGSYDLADVAASGGKIRFLTSTPQYDELEPSYSPDGKTITFVRLLHGTALDAEGDLWSLNIDTGHSYALDVTGRAPVWSADSLKLAYMSMRSGKWNVYVHDFIAGSDDLVSFGCPTNCGWPEWAPDSKSIAYTATKADDSNQPDTIFVWSPERRLPRVLVSGAVGRPSWSSAGLIAYSSGLGLEISNAESPARQLLLDDVTASMPEWAQ